MSTDPHKLAEPLDAADPYAREAQTFPALSAEMAGRIARFGEEESLAHGDTLFRRGERSVDFFLVLDGAVDIIDHDEREGEQSSTSTVRHAHLLVRGEGLAATMSRYLIDRIDAGERITLHRYCEVEEVGGERGMEWLRWRVRGQEPETVDAAALFVMIGAAPNSEWLTGVAETDEKGFVCTGSDGSPFMTSAPGLFAVGDVRSGSVKRVASAVGEGSVVIQFVHRYLEERSRGDHRLRDNPSNVAAREADAVAAE